MRQDCFFLFISLPALLFLGGCNDNQNRQYSLNLLVSEPIGLTANDTLPEYIIQLALPYGICGDVFYIPKTTLERLGVEKSATNLETSIKTVPVGDQFDINQIEQQARAKLETLIIGEAFASPTQEGLDLRSQYKSILGEKSAKAAVLVFSKKISMSEFKGNKVYHNLDSLRFAIAQMVCEGGVSSVKVLLEPFWEKINARPKLVTNLSELEAAIEIIEEHPADTWEELYDASKPFILTEDEHAYGHPSAYCYIVRAAQKAIKTNTSQKMYDQMSLDCPGQSIDNDICRLKVGHEKFWNAVRGALLEKNSEELEEMEERLIGAWKRHLRN